MKFSFFANSDDSFFESKQLDERVYWFLLSIVLVFIAVVRFRLLDFPLERDEGEYAYMGQLLLQGIPPYKFAYNMKLPGTYGMYALIMGIFGETTRGIHMGYMFINISTVIILFLFIKKLCNSFVALVSSVAYGVYSMNPFVLGFAAHATHFVLFWSLLGIYLLLSATERKTKILYFWVGILFGLGFLMKQQAIFLILFSGFYFLYHSYSEFKLGTFQFRDFLIRGILLVVGTVLPFIVTVGFLIYSGVFASFWYWTFQYASKYASMATLADGWKNFSDTVFVMSYGLKFLWSLVVLGFILQFFIKQDKSKKVFLLLLATFSFLTTTPGLYFRQHYFIVFLPFFFVYLGISLEFFRKLLLIKLNVVAATLIVCTALPFLFRLKAHREYYFKADPLTLSRAIYGVNPFPEAIKISEYIKQNTSENDTIAVLGSEPEIYFYSNRKSATGFIYMYPLMEIHPYSKEMQMNLVKDIEENKPKFLVYVNNDIKFTWGISKDSEKYLLNWIADKKNENYELVGIVEIISQSDAIYKWGDEAISHKPNSIYYIEILKRK